MMIRSFYLGLLISLLISVSFALYAYSEASSPKYRGDSYYVSDEVWYVTSSRNLLHEIFGLKPRYPSQGYVHMTLAFGSERELIESYGWLNETLRSLGGSVLRSNYTSTGDRIPAVWVRVPESRAEELERELGGRVKVRYGFEYPSKAGIVDYLNLEHPPLGKYMMMLSMMILGDEPIGWRVPGILEGSALIVIVYLIVRRILNPFWGVLASISLALDPMLHAMSVVAMLDIHLAFFTGLTLLFAVEDRPLAASIASWLAFSVKFSGLFAVLFTYLYIRIYRREGPVRSALLSLIPSILYPLISLPLIVHLGLGRWISENLSAMAWHTTSRGSGPVPSPPWAWFLNLAPMALHINPDLLARVNTVSYAFSGAFTLLLLPLLARRERSYLPMMMILSIVTGYTLVYIAGNRTLYSFYAIQLAPSVASSFAISMFYLVMMEDELNDLVVGGWRGILRRLLESEPRLPEELRPLEIISWGGRGHYFLSMVAAVLLSTLMHSSLGIPGSPVYMLEERDFGLSSQLSRLLISSSESLILRELLFCSIALISILIISLDLLELGLSSQPMVISLIVLSGYDWGLLSLALALESLILSKRGRPILSAMLLAISASLNPLNFLLFPTLLGRSGIRSSLLFLGIFIPLSLLSPEWPGESVGGLLSPLIGDQAPILALMISAALTAYLTRFDRLWSSAIGIGLMTLLAGLKPSWGLIEVALLSGSPVLPLMELLLSHSLLSYSNPSLLSSALLKCSARSPRDVCSDPYIAITLFSLISIYLGARRIFQKRLELSPIVENTD
ncbi:MAG: hypothetical protein BA066_05125 [Candidatus Korarchaeota archaeon NZ13-K]|nr:MAG: hypothetical protein BA066_05125 [Candidatus Korarchaeota archaeon NZ13-K]